MNIIDQQKHKNSWILLTFPLMYILDKYIPESFWNYFLYIRNQRLNKIKFKKFFFLFAHNRYNFLSQRIYHPPHTQQSVATRFIDMTNQTHKIPIILLNTFRFLNDGKWNGTNMKILSNIGKSLNDFHAQNFPL